MKKKGGRKAKRDDERGERALSMPLLSVGTIVALNCLATWSGCILLIDEAWVSLQPALPECPFFLDLLTCRTLEWVIRHSTCCSNGGAIMACWAPNLPQLNAEQWLSATLFPRVFSVKCVLMLRLSTCRQRGTNHHPLLWAASCCCYGNCMSIRLAARSSQETIMKWNK